MIHKSKLLMVIAIVMAFFVGTITANASPRYDMVDVSNNNGAMSTGEFVYMRNNYGVKAITTKISEGTYYQDWTAAGNIKAAQNAGLYINAYHFARYSTVAQAVAEANFAAQTAQADGLPVGAVLVADVEAEQQNGNGYYANEAANNAFMETVRQYGYRSTIYTMGSWVNSQFPVNKGWIARYPYNPSGSWYSDHHSWQWTSSASFACSIGSFDVSQNYDSFFTAETNTGWQNNSKGYWYNDGNGKFVTGWRYIDGQWFYFNNQGWMLAYWQHINGSWYYLDPAHHGNYGAMKSGWQFINGKWYDFDSNGRMKTGWFVDGGNWYLSDSNGVMLQWWHKIDGTWYFLNTDGHMANGWQWVNGHWYLFNNSGAMLTGWQWKSGHWYQLAGDGHMLTGWSQYKGDWYYLNDDGSMSTGWVSQSIWYHMNSNGAMQTGSQIVNGKSYQFDSNGKMK